MLIHQGWFTAINIPNTYTIHSLEFEICIFPREAIPSHYFPLREDSSRVLAWDLHWVRQLRSGSCHHPTTATKCNKQPSQATETPSVEKHAHPPRVVYCAIYPTLTRFTVSSLKFAYFQGSLSRHITSPSEKTRPESWLGDYMGKATPFWQLSSSHRCHQM